MNKHYLFIVLLLLLSCKKAPTIDFDSLSTVKTNEKGEKIFEIDTTLISPFKSKSLTEFYRSRNNETVWQSKKNRETILETIKNCESEGLNPSDYNISKLLELEKKFPN